MTIKEQIVNGLQANDLFVVKELLGVNPVEVTSAIASVVSGPTHGSQERYNAFLAMAFCKETGHNDFPIQAEEIYHTFVGNL